MARPTQDAKESTIKLRLNEEQRKYVEAQANKKSTSMSQYIRDLIDKDRK